MHDSEIADLVNTARVGRLATVDESGSPHIVPVCFAWSEGRFYISLDEKPKRVPPERLRRVRNIIANPHVQLLIDRYEEDWSRLAYVQLRGRASLLQPGPEQARAVAALQAKYEQYGAMDITARPVIRIDVDEVVSWPASPPSPRTSDPMTGGEGALGRMAPS